MGYNVEYTLIVSSIFEKNIIKTSNKIREFCMIENPLLLSCLTPIVPSIINGIYTVCFLTSGSKEDWEESNNHKMVIERFINYWKEEHLKFDCMSHCHWVYLRYGDDEGKTEILDHSENPLYNIEEE